MKREREREGRKKEERDGRRLPGSTSWPRRRGYIRMSELRDLKEGEHVVANLSELGQSIRVEATNLSNYIQSMVRQFDNAPIDYDSWHDVPSGFKEKMIAELEELMKEGMQEVGGSESTEGQRHLMLVVLPDKLF
uniref:Uncharacterized protein LOC105033335 isoform X4 n=1 Tax=Elaeis guineensis var. tenera TaxID=51953 RepID=A0A6I9QB42_ELAGV|nr:uncharacterized protein LOC105033335 isoform X4 [Elaeis guineensis]XP_010906398.1 uncharacterized protein LOC105033335 isoform X4 [Elaeis guineensis]